VIHSIMCVHVCFGFQKDFDTLNTTPASRKVQSSVTMLINKVHICTRRYDCIYSVDVIPLNGLNHCSSVIHLFFLSSRSSVEISKSQVFLSVVMEVTGASSHWENVYATKEDNKVSWFQPKPQISLDLVASVGVRKNGALIDVAVEHQHWLTFS